MSDQKPRVRFAPSPTGYLHVGGARTALYNFLYARKLGGQFILRIEDTDQERSTEESLRMQLQDLRWLGLTWDEGPEFETLADVGEFGPYRQSQRLDIYQKYVNQLLQEGKAYHCFHTEEEIESQSLAKGEHFKSQYRDLSLAEAEKLLAAGQFSVVRFKNHQEEKKYAFDDLIRGHVEFSSSMVGDFVLLRSTGMPVYNFCCVIDDYLMKMTHVFRAEEHLSNSLRQLMIYEALGFEAPLFAHMSLILGSDRQKLSKRHGATSCNQYRELGFLPEAVSNYLALLGWSPGEDREIMSVEEMTELFSTERLNKAAAVFDETKLRWVNSVHLRALPNDELWRRVQPFIERAGLRLPADSSWQARALEVFKVKMEVLSDAVELLAPFDEEGFAVADEGREVLAWESSKPVIEKWLSLVEGSAEVISEEDFSSMQNTVKTECGVKGKFLFMPLRVSVVGKPHGAELQKVVPLMSKQQLLGRARQCLSQL